CFARGEAVLREQLRDGPIGCPLLSQLGDDILRGKQVLEFLRTTGSKFFDRLADCGGIKGGHRRIRREWIGDGPGNVLATIWKPECVGADKDKSSPWTVPDWTAVVDMPGFWPWNRDFSRTFRVSSATHSRTQKPCQIKG